MSDLLADLTPAQREAVTHFEGPLLILAGAGSGKTRVITRRVAWLLRQGVRPWNVLAITFTNKAAGEMRQRVEALVPDSRVWMSTFHSLGARLLRQYADRLAIDKNFTIYDTDDRNKIVKEALNAAGIDAKCHYPIAIHQQEGYPWGKQARIAASVPNSERNAACCISLPMFPELTQDEIDFVIEETLKWDRIAG